MGLIPANININVSGLKRVSDILTKKSAGNAKKYT